MQAPDQFGGLNIGRVLIAESTALHTEDEAELLHTLWQVPEGKLAPPAFIQIMQFEALEIAGQDVAWPFSLGQGVKIFPCLTISLFEITPGALLLNQQYTGPEQVDEAGMVIQLPYMLLKTRHRAALDPKDVEEIIVEALSFSTLAHRIPPLVGESGGAGTNLIPR
ncbi:MAG: hypothetical protein OXC05_11685 [Halieaceae bacterium]|nr:hypothetical protein [Halieaceae bacterium]